MIHVVDKNIVAVLPTYGNVETDSSVYKCPFAFGYCIHLSFIPFSSYVCSVDAHSYNLITRTYNTRSEASIKFN